MIYAVPLVAIVTATLIYLLRNPEASPPAFSREALDRDIERFHKHLEGLR